MSSTTEDTSPTDELSHTQQVEDVKEVTKGVKEVELEDEGLAGSSSEMAPDDAATVPLPESPVLKATEITEAVDESRDPDSLVSDNNSASEETVMMGTTEEKDVGEVVAADELKEGAVKETEEDIEPAPTKPATLEENHVENSATLVATPHVDE